MGLNTHKMTSLRDTLNIIPHSQFLSSPNSGGFICIWLLFIVIASEAKQSTC